jgi:hypothetical protein
MECNDVDYFHVASSKPVAGPCELPEPIKGREFIEHPSDHTPPKEEEHSSMEYSAYQQ